MRSQCNVQLWEKCCVLTHSGDRRITLPTIKRSLLSGCAAADTGCDAIFLAFRPLQLLAFCEIAGLKLNAWCCGTEPAPPGRRSRVQELHQETLQDIRRVMASTLLPCDAHFIPVEMVICMSAIVKYHADPWQRNGGNHLTCSVSAGTPSWTVYAAFNGNASS